MPSINLRLTDEQHAEIVAAAEENHRSMQGEIVHRLFPPPRPTDAAFREWERHFKGPDPKPTKAEKGRRR